MLFNYTYETNFNKMSLEKLEKQLRTICSQHSYCYKLEYSEVENLFYGYIEDYSWGEDMWHGIEVKKIGSIKRLIGYLIIKLGEYKKI